MVNDEGYLRAHNELFNYLTEGYLTEMFPASPGYDYFLQARKENIIDPRTEVEGTWDL